MPFTAARNQLLDVISAFSMSSFPWRVGYDVVHTLITFFCISIILFHLSSIIMSFPTHKPRVLMGLPSFIRQTYLGFLFVLVPRILSVITLFLCLGVPMGVLLFVCFILFYLFYFYFFILNHAVDTPQNMFIIVTELYHSFLD